MAFYVGQKVVCVNERNTTNSGKRELLEGATYTISWIGMWSDPCYGGRELCVHLFEIDRGVEEGWEQYGPTPFKAIRFRPVVKTDISIFTRMLEPQKETA